MSGFFISKSDFSSLTESTKKELFVLFNGDAMTNKTVGAEWEGYADLSIPQAKQLIEGLSDSTYEALKMIVDGCTYYQIAQTLKVDDLRGVMSGITKRVRTVTGDDKFELIFWEKVDGGTEFNTEIDHTGEIHPRTVEALKIVFNN